MRGFGVKPVESPFEQQHRITSAVLPAKRGRTDPSGIGKDSGIATTLGCGDSCLGMCPSQFAVTGFHAELAGQDVHPREERARRTTRRTRQLLAGGRRSELEGGHTASQGGVPGSPELGPAGREPPPQPGQIRGGSDGGSGKERSNPDSGTEGEKLATVYQGTLPELRSTR